MPFSFRENKIKVKKFDIGVHWYSLLHAYGGLHFYYTNVGNSQQFRFLIKKIWSKRLKSDREKWPNFASSLSFNDFKNFKDIGKRNS